MTIASQEALSEPALKLIFVLRILIFDKVVRSGISVITKALYQCTYYGHPNNSISLQSDLVYLH